LDISKLPSTPSFLTSLELPSGASITAQDQSSDVISADQTRLAVLLNDQNRIRLWDTSVSPPQFRCDFSASFSPDLSKICCVSVAQNMLFIVGREGFAVYNTHPSAPINAGHHIPVDQPYTNLLKNINSQYNQCSLVSATVQNGNLVIFMNDQSSTSGQQLAISTIYAVNISEPPFKANTIATFTGTSASNGQFPFVRSSNAMTAMHQPIIFTYYPSSTKPDVYVDELGKGVQQHALDDTAFKFMHSCCGGNQAANLLGFVVGPHCLVCVGRNGICAFD
jgi:hypothetical protein